MKLTVEEYAIREGISKTAVYGRIKKGSINSEKFNGKTYIIEKEELSNPNENNQNNQITTISKKRLKKLEKKSIKYKLIKEQIKDIKRREDQVRELQQMIAQRDDFIFKISSNLLPEPKESVIDVEVKKKSKKKKKR